KCARVSALRLGAALSARSLPFEPSEPAELVRNRPRTPILGRKLEQVVRVTHLRWLLRPRVVPYSVRYPIEASEFLLGGSGGRCGGRSRRCYGCRLSRFRRVGDRDWKQRLYGAPLKLNPDRHKDVVYKVMVEVEPGITAALQQLVGELILHCHLE